MASLNDRLRALEEPGGDYPEHIVASALRRIPTSQLRSCVEVMECALEEGSRAEEAEGAVWHISQLCEAVLNETRKKGRKE